MALLVLFRQTLQLLRQIILRLLYLGDLFPCFVQTILDLRLYRANHGESLADFSLQVLDIPQYLLGDEGVQLAEFPGDEVSSV